MNKFFDNKQGFLNCYSDEVKRVYASNFKKISEVEGSLNKDVLNFSKKELGFLFEHMESSSALSLQNLVIKIDNYIKYKNSNGEISNEEKESHPINNYKNINTLIQFIKNNDEMIFTRDEIYYMADYAENAQDGVLLALLFEGVSHKNEMLEMREIKESDVDFENNTIYIKNREKNIPLSNSAMRMINRAIREEFYFSTTGESRRKYKLTENGYLLRGTRKNSDMIATRNITQRIRRLSEAFEREELNSVSLNYSGQIDEFYKLVNSGVGESEACEKALEKFNFSVNDSSKHYLKNRIRRYEVEKRKAENNSL